MNGLFTNIRVINKAVLPKNTNLKTINGVNLINDCNDCVDITPFEMGTIVKEQITTASTIGEVAGTTYYYFCLTGDSYDLPRADSNECVYNFKNDGSSVIYLNADTGAGDTIEVEERGTITIGTQLRVPPYESRCITSFGTTWRIF